MDLAVYMSHSISFDLLRICRTPSCAGTDRKPTGSPQQKSTTSCRTISKSHNKLWTTCRTASPQQIHQKLHATISNSCSKSHNLLYDESTGDQSINQSNIYIVPIIEGESEALECGWLDVIGRREKVSFKLAGLESDKTVRWANVRRERIPIIRQ